MEPEQIAGEQEVIVETKQSVWNTVTPLSKYLAMVLFIAMPFVGGWIGYTYAPEKVAEVEKVVIKEVEVEISNKVERFSETDGRVSNSFSEVTQRTETQSIALDIGNYSEGVLIFDVGVQRKINDNSLFIDFLNFDGATGLVSLKDYSGQGVDNDLMQIFKRNEAVDLETQVENIILGDAKQESEINEGLIWRLGDNYDPQNNNLTYRSLCKLEIVDETINNPTKRTPIKKRISVNHDNLLIENESDLRGMTGPCGSHRFLVLDNLVIQNFSRPVDALTPKIIGDINIDYNLSYVHSTTGETVYLYDFLEK